MWMNADGIIYLGKNFEMQPLVYKWVPSIYSSEQQQKKW